jgi:hypothetical protein
MLEFWSYIKSFSQDWVTTMTGGASLVIPFGNLIAERVSSGKLLPEWTLIVVAALCFLVASFRVWRVEHRRLQALPLRMLLVDLELCRRHWKRHEHDYLKVGTPYFPFSGTPDQPEKWTAQNINEYKDKIQLQNQFLSHAGAVRDALEKLQDSRLPPLVAHLSGPLLYTINGHQLDEMIRDEEAMLKANVAAIEKSGVRAYPAPPIQYVVPSDQPPGGDSGDMY